MRPATFPEHNRVFTRPVTMGADLCVDLQVFDTTEEFISKWEPSPEERAAIAAGGPVWLYVFGRGHPPVMLSGLSPFEEHNGTSR